MAIVAQMSNVAHDPFVCKKVNKKDIYITVYKISLFVDVILFFRKPELLR